MELLDGLGIGRGDGSQVRRPTITQEDIGLPMSRIVSPRA